MSREKFRDRIRKEMAYTSKEKMIRELIDEGIWTEKKIRQRWNALEARKEKGTK